MYSSRSAARRGSGTANARALTSPAGQPPVSRSGSNASKSLPARFAFRRTRGRPRRVERDLEGDGAAHREADERSSGESERVEQRDDVRGELDGGDARGIWRRLALAVTREIERDRAESMLD
ncbi:MAG TPA: hypothetical protein VGK79_06560 [Gaiellaceae bacterium]